MARFAVFRTPSSSHNERCPHHYISFSCPTNTAGLPCARVRRDHKAVLSRSPKAIAVSNYSLLAHFLGATRLPHWYDLCARLALDLAANLFRCASSPPAIMSLCYLAKYKAAKWRQLLRMLLSNLEYPRDQLCVCSQVCVLTPRARRRKRATFLGEFLRFLA